MGSFYGRFQSIANTLAQLGFRTLHQISCSMIGNTECLTDFDPRDVFDEAHPQRLTGTVGELIQALTQGIDGFITCQILARPSLPTFIEQQGRIGDLHPPPFAMVGNQQIVGRATKILRRCLVRMLNEVVSAKYP